MCDLPCSYEPGRRRPSIPSITDLSIDVLLGIINTYLPLGGILQELCVQLIDLTHVDVRVQRELLTNKHVPVQ